MKKKKHVVTLIFVTHDTGCALPHCTRGFKTAKTKLLLIFTYVISTTNYYNFN